MKDIQPAAVSHQAVSGTCKAKDVRAQLRRILASREFSASPRMQEFLALAVADVLAGRGDRLKEYVIGVEVFHRPASFDPGIDPIVRVEARRLRAKLERFYSGEGRYDGIVIELPKGGYAPSFRARTAAETVPAVSRENRIAVLPFQPVGSTTEAQQFSEGLTWELTHRLTRIEGLTVVASHSVAQLRDSAADAAAAGARLGVSGVLTGSVREAAGRIRIIAQLVSTESGVYLWSETYDRKLEDVFSIQDDIAHAIVSKLRVQFAPEEQAPPPRRPGYHPEAYQLYLRGRARWNSRTEEGMRASLELFQRAVELEPQFALAYAGMADAYATIADYALEPPTIAVPASKAAALRALELDGSLAEAHCSLAFHTALYEWKWEEAELHYRHALDLNPGYATAHHWYSCDHLALLGRFEESKEEMEMAMQLDPLSRIISEGRGYIRMMERRYAEAEEVLRALTLEAPDFHKGHASLGRSLVHQGRYDEALECFEKAWTLNPGVPKLLGAIGQTLALSGRGERARVLLAELMETGKSRYVPSSCFALIHAGLGESQRAIEWLERGVEARELSMPVLGVHPGYDSLRDEPRFQQLLKRMNLEGVLKVSGERTVSLPQRRGNPGRYE